MRWSSWVCTKKKKRTKNGKMSELERYLELPYTVLLRRDGDGDFVAKIEELPGCSSHGKTREEALGNLDEAKSLWIQDCLENGDPVPLPAEDEPLPSGKWLQRVPRKLHRKLQELSKKEGVSFNQCVTALFAEAVGEHKAVQVGQISFHTTEALTARWAEYFGKQNFEPLLLDWLLVNLTSPHTQLSVYAAPQTLALFSS